VLIPGRLYRLNSVCDYSLAVNGEHKGIHVCPGDVVMILRVETTAFYSASEFVRLTLLLANGAVGTNSFWTTSWEHVG
jgi:hypothetical protein